MPGRTINSTVQFAAPFTLNGIDGVQPAGEYEVDHHEESIDGVSFLAYRRVATFIHIPARSAHAQKSQLFSIDPADLEAALIKDRETNR